MNVLVFDIETIPDCASGRKLYDLPGDLSDEQVAQAMFSKRREKTGSDFLPAHLQKVVAISAVYRNTYKDTLSVWTIGDEESSEAEIVAGFFAEVDKTTPTLVTWNGSGFDLPVLHYRSLVNGVQASRYWDTGDDDQSFKWNNYISRFHSRHTDLMDVMAGYNNRAFAPLDEIALMLDLPGKMAMDGGKVWDEHLAGNLKGIRDYCETDALNTYLVYLQWLFMRGDLNTADLDREQQVLITALEEGADHHKAFLQAWG